MNANPFFSIIIPVYNVAPYLSATLDSVCNQTFKDWECYCVDDGSTDGSSEILDEYARRDSRIKVVHKENRGVSSARNTGIEHANGEWIMFLDSDDAYVSTALLKIHESLNCIKCEIVVFQPKYVTDVREMIGGEASEEGTVINTDNVAQCTKFLEQTFPHHLWAWNKCFKRALIGDLRFQDFQPCEDAIFSLECVIRAEHILELPNVLYKYLQHEGSCLKTVSKKRILGDIQGMEGLSEVLCRWRFFHAVRRFAYRQLRDVFLHGIAIRIRQCKESREVISQLKRLYFDSAKRVFVELPISPGCAKLFYRILFVFRSVFVVHATLAIRRRVLGALRLRKGLG